MVCDIYLEFIKLFVQKSQPIYNLAFYLFYLSLYQLAN